MERCMKLRLRPEVAACMTVAGITLRASQSKSSSTIVLNLHYESRTSIAFPLLQHRSQVLRFIDAALLRFQTRDLKRFP
jgi:hypothetical protein